MAKVIQIRDVPDEVHDALTAAARDEGLSLSRYARKELEESVRRTAAIRHNAEVIRQARAQRTGKPVPREAILAALHEGRDER